MLCLGQALTLLGNQMPTYYAAHEVMHVEGVTWDRHFDSGQGGWVIDGRPTKDEGAGPQQLPSDRPDRDPLTHRTYSLAELGQFVGLLVKRSKARGTPGRALADLEDALFYADVMNAVVRILRIQAKRDSEKTGTSEVK